MGWRLLYAPLSGKYISIPDLNIPAATDFAIEFQWANEDTGIAYIACHTASTANRLILEPSVTSNNLRLFTSAGSGLNMDIGSNSRTDDNVFLITRTGSTLTLHVNGVLTSTATSATILNGAFLFTRFFVRGTTVISPQSQLTYFKVSIAGSPLVNYDASASGGTGTTLPELVSSLNGTQVGTWPADDAEWVFYDAGGDTPFTGTISKLSLSVSGKTPNLVTGFNSPLSKLVQPLSNKSLQIATGFNALATKQSLTLGNKQSDLSAGYLQDLGKLAVPLSGKQLQLFAGADIPFVGEVLRSNLTLTGKQLNLSTGWSGSPPLNQLNLSAKSLEALAGFNSSLSELSLDVVGKQLSLTTGTEVSFLGEIAKGSLDVTGKPLQVATGNNTPFTGQILKGSLELSGKVLNASLGQVLEIQKQSLSLIGKQLSFGLPVYPITPVERLFVMKVGTKQFLMKQTTTIYIMRK